MILFLIFINSFSLLVLHNDYRLLPDKHLTCVCVPDFWDTILSYYPILSYDVASGSDITPCNKIYKPLVVYQFTGKVMQ